MQTGRFIVVEGPNLAGKTAFIAALAARFEQAGRSVVRTREPGGSKLGEAVRPLLKTIAASDFTRALIFNGIRNDHASSVISPALAHGKVVLCDRYFHSTEVFQIALSENVTPAEAEVLRTIHRAMPQPDLTVFILPEPELVRQRAFSRKSEIDAFEGNPAELVAYTNLAHTYSQHAPVVILRPGVGNEDLTSAADSIVAADFCGAFAPGISSAA